MSLQSTYQSRKNLLASNLTAQGVTASGTEGLTSLIDKVLDIEAGKLSLTSNKLILSYYTSETATLTATHNLRHTGLNVSVYNAVTGTKIGDMTDNNDGTYSYTYNSAGVGDISMTCATNYLESNSITIEDCYYYDSTEITVTNSSTTVYDALATGVENIINQNWILNFDLNNVSGGGAVLNIGAKSQYSPPSSANYRLTIGRDATIISMNNRTTSSTFRDSGTVLNETWYNVQMKKETINGTTTIYASSDKASWASNSLVINWLGNYNEYDLYLLGWANANCKIKNIKLKVIP